MGLQRETAGRGTLAVYSSIILATMLERILFHTVPTYLLVVSTRMILVSALYIVVCSCPLHIPCTMGSLINEIQMVADEGETKGTIDQPVRLPVSNDEALEQGLASWSGRA